MSCAGELQSDGSGRASASSWAVAQAESVRLGVPIRNPNYLKLGISWLVVGAAALAVNIVSSFRLEELGAFILGVPVLLGAVEVVKWQRVFLRADSAGITEQRVARCRSFAWSEIDQFDICEPVRRTPLMLSFAWWADRCSLRLVTGDHRSVPAVQPYHGFTILTVLNLRRWTDADAVVDELNGMVRRSRQAP